MDKRLIAVLTDLDLAEYYLRKQRHHRALSVVSVALLNAIEGHQQCSPGTPEFDAWEDAVQRAYRTKSVVLSEQTG